VIWSDHLLSRDFGSRIFHARGIDLQRVRSPESADDEPVAALAETLCAGAMSSSPCLAELDKARHGEKERLRSAVTMN
jgi:hypothetical protein